MRQFALIFLISFFYVCIFFRKKNHPTTTICFASSRVCVRVRARERKRERERVYGRVGVRACTCMCVRLIFVLLFRASYKENSTTELLVDWTCVVFLSFPTRSHDKIGQPQKIQLRITFL